MEYRYLAVARQAAAAAAAEIKKGADRKPEYKMKTSHADLVTVVDQAAEAKILNIISRELGAGHEVLAEETYARAGADLGHISGCPHLWLIDPLDGTTNFVHGLPLYGVSIAYASYGEIRVGLVCDVVRGVHYYAVKGGGCFRDGQPVQVSDEATLRESLVATGFQYDVGTGTRLNLKQFATAARHCRNVRALGSAALALAWVACGQLSGFWELRLGPWDMAAGSLLVSEAGGLVTDRRGGEFTVFQPSIVASNGLIQQDLVGILQQHAADDNNEQCPVPGARHR